MYDILIVDSSVNDSYFYKILFYLFQVHYTGSSLFKVKKNNNNNDNELFGVKVKDR